MTILNFYLSESKLETLLNTVRKKGEKGVGITAVIADEPDKYGNNVAFHVSQTKEQREAKAERFYVANGKVVYSNSEVKVAPKMDAPAPSKKQVEDDLPF
jgi:hypothetical protein